MGLKRFGLVVLAALTVAGCTQEPPSPTPTPAASTAPEASASPAGPTYKASTLDLCAKTDLAPLADLSLKLEGKDDSPPNGGPGAACFFKFKTAGGHLASLRVEAMAVSSAEEAEKAFKSQQNVSVMKSDGPVSGLGDQAEGRTLDSEPGFKQSEYMIHGRVGNLTFKAWLSVGGNAFTPKTTLAPKVNTIAKALLTTASSAWLQTK
jgi:hypothetical protein